jgi:microsomal dipeptidase-like Zn-dependent dipeptidase
MTLLLSLSLVHAEEVRGQIDWQAHPAMHIPWGFFRPGLTDEAPEVDAQHTFTQTMHGPYVDDSGVRILMAAAMAAERARNPVQARELILEQLRYVEDFVASHPDRYAMARTSTQARELLLTTDKQVVIHSIEGGRELFWRQTDAAFWADQGVALVTPTHLWDDEIGGSALLPGLLGRLLNPVAAGKRRRGEYRGLTPRGREVLVELDQAGILVDLTHMSPTSVEQSLVITAAHGIAPVVTHGHLHSIQASEGGLLDAQIVEIYRQGGVFNLPVGAEGLAPVDPRLPQPDGYCPGTLDAFKWQYEAVGALLDEHLPELLGVSTREELTETQRTALAVGWSSDWNGWVSHSEPKYGKGACHEDLPSDALDIDTQGLAHPGLLPQHWQRLSEAGMDLDPMLRSAERFLQLWEHAGSGEDG